MPRSAKDIQLIELKDTILKLNELIMTQTKSMDSLQKTIEELRQELSNKQAEVDYLKAKLFGASSEKLKVPFPGQINLFEEMPDDRIPEIIEPEIIDVSAHKRERKPGIDQQGHPKSRLQQQGNTPSPHSIPPFASSTTDSSLSCIGSEVRLA